MTEPSAQEGANRPGLEAHLGAFGTHLAKRSPPLCPELTLWLLGDDCFRGRFE